MDWRESIVNIALIKGVILTKEDIDDIEQKLQEDSELWDYITTVISEYVSKYDK